MKKFFWVKLPNDTVTIAEYRKENDLYFIPGEYEGLSETDILIGDEVKDKVPQA